MSKPDYEYKSYVLREHSELLDNYLRSNKYEYVLSLLRNEGVISPSIEYLQSKDTMRKQDLIEYCFNNNLIKELREVIKIDKARNNRVYRLRKRVEAILKSDCGAIFLTLTFSDNTLSNTTEKNRRNYVQRYLKSLDCLYVGNIDFGKTNHREHYHALVAVDNVNGKAWRKYGNINFERVRIADRTSTKISKYIAKLTNHAIKETTKRKALIYSR